jgi:hypothetical protein
MNGFDGFDGLRDAVRAVNGGGPSRTRENPAKLPSELPGASLGHYRTPTAPAQPRNAPQTVPGAPMKTLNEPIRALGWTIALVTGLVAGIFGAVAIIVLGGALAVSVIGAPAGITLTLLTACVAIAVAIWLGNGKQRP